MSILPVFISHISPGFASVQLPMKAWLWVGGNAGNIRTRRSTIRPPAFSIGLLRGFISRVFPY